MWMGELLSAAGVVDRTGVGGGRIWRRPSTTAVPAAPLWAGAAGRAWKVAARRSLHCLWWYPHFCRPRLPRGWRCRRESRCHPALQPHRYRACLGTKDIGFKSHSFALSHPSFPVSFIYRSGENGGITELSVVSLPAVQLRLWDTQHTRTKTGEGGGGEWTLEYSFKSFFNMVILAFCSGPSSWWSHRLEPVTQPSVQHYLYADTSSTTPLGWERKTKFAPIVLFPHNDTHFRMNSS